MDTGKYQNTHTQRPPPPVELDIAFSGGSARGAGGLPLPWLSLWSPPSAPPKFLRHWMIEMRSLSVELRLKTMLER